MHITVFHRVKQTIAYVDLLEIISSNKQLLHVHGKIFKDNRIYGSGANTGVYVLIFYFLSGLDSCIVTFHLVYQVVGLRILIVCVMFSILRYLTYKKTSNDFYADMFSKCTKDVFCMF